MLGNCWVTVSRLDPAKHWFPGPTGEWANGGPPSNAASVRGAVRSVRTSAGASSSPPTGAWPDAGWASPAHSSRPNRSAARSADRRAPGGVSSSPWLYIQLEALQRVSVHLELSFSQCTFEQIRVWEGKTQSGEIGDPVTMHELLRILLLMLARLFRERHDLLVENLLLRHQLHVALRSRPRPDLKSRDRFFWLVVRSLYPDWKQHLILVRPETVVRWHRRGWRLYWRWRSGHQLGRPRLSPEIRELIATMASANPLWGTERIRGELLKLGIVVSSRSIRRYRRRRNSRPPSQSWRTFLANHAQAIWAADLFVVQTLTFQTLYVIFFISHGSRQLVHFEVTANPNAAWVWRQLIEATPWDRKPRYLIHDRDRVWAPTSASARPAWLSRVCGPRFRRPARTRSRNAG